MWVSIKLYNVHNICTAAGSPTVHQTRAHTSNPVRLQLIRGCAGQSTSSAISYGRGVKPPAMNARGTKSRADGVKTGPKARGIKGRISKGTGGALRREHGSGVSSGGQGRRLPTGTGFNTAKHTSPAILHENFVEGAGLVFSRDEN